MRISDWSSDVCSSDLSAPYSEDPAIDAKVWEILHVAHVFERAGEFDLIHNQADFVPLAFSGLVETPVVTTIHGFSSERIFQVFQSYADRVAYDAICEYIGRASCGDGVCKYAEISGAAVYLKQKHIFVVA